jgi:serine/threonine protein kinase
LVPEGWAKSFSLCNESRSHAAFVREAKSARALDHPNIAHVYEIDGTHFIPMEFIEGAVASEALAEIFIETHDLRMIEKEIVLETIRELPDDCTLDEIAERIKFMAAVQKGLDELDGGESIPHEQFKKQLASWL